MLRRRRDHATAKITVVPMEVSRLDEVIEIERAVFATPWSRSLYRQELLIGDSRIYLVALESGRVIGYVGLMLVIDEVHVTTIAVHPEHRGRAIGKLLLYLGLIEAVERGATSATLEVRVSNVSAQSLYHQFGFVPAGIRKNYYAEDNEDGLVMWAHDLAGEESRSRLLQVLRSLSGRGLLAVPGSEDRA